MDRAEEGQHILASVTQGRFRLLSHASQRSMERGVFVEQIVRCAKSCFHWRWQEKQGTHLYLGFFLPDRPGGFTAVLFDDVLVVTVFKRRLTQWEKKLAKSVKR